MKRQLATTLVVLAVVTVMAGCGVGPSSAGTTDNKASVNSTDRASESKNDRKAGNKDRQKSRYDEELAELLHHVVTIRRASVTWTTQAKAPNYDKLSTAGIDERVGGINGCAKTTTKQTVSGMHYECVEYNSLGPFDLSYKVIGGGADYAQSLLSRAMRRVGPEVEVDPLTLVIVAGTHSGSFPEDAWESLKRTYDQWSPDPAPTFYSATRADHKQARRSPQDATNESDTSDDELLGELKELRNKPDGESDQDQLTDDAKNRSKTNEQSTTTTNDRQSPSSATEGISGEAPIFIAVFD